MTHHAGMAELADAPDLGSGGFSMEVQILLPAPYNKNIGFHTSVHTEVLFY
jgi:hypothetical protein